MQQWLDRALELDNAVISAAPAVTFGLHLCRGNQASRWLAEGSYEPIAPTVFRKNSRLTGFCLTTMMCARDHSNHCGRFPTISLWYLA